MSIYRMYKSLCNLEESKEGRVEFLITIFQQADRNSAVKCGTESNTIACRNRIWLARLGDQATNPKATEISSTPASPVEHVEGTTGSMLRRAMLLNVSFQDGANQMMVRVTLTKGIPSTKKRLSVIKNKHT
eukprot:g32103.t1